MSVKGKIFFAKRHKHQIIIKMELRNSLKYFFWMGLSRVMGENHMWIFTHSGENPSYHYCYRPKKLIVDLRIRLPAAD